MLIDDPQQDHERCTEQRGKGAVDLLGDDERVDREKDQAGDDLGAHGRSASLTMERKYR